MHQSNQVHFLIANTRGLAISICGIVKFMGLFFAKVDLLIFGFLPYSFLPYLVLLSLCASLAL
jgi:hypothetical protein